MGVAAGVRGEAKRTATSARKAAPLSALATLWEAPLMRVPVQLIAPTARIRPQARIAAGTSLARLRRWTYSANTADMNPLAATFCSQASQPARKPTVGPKARRAIG